MIRDELPAYVSTMLETHGPHYDTHLSMVSCGFPFFKYLSAFVRWSFKITAS